MICPKCDMEIDEVILVERKTKIGVLEGNKVVKLHSRDNDIITMFYVECFECGFEIEFALETDDPELKKYIE